MLLDWNVFIGMPKRSRSKESIARTCENVCRLQTQKRIIAYKYVRKEIRIIWKLYKGLYFILKLKYVSFFI